MCGCDEEAASWAHAARMCGVLQSISGRGEPGRVFFANKCVQGMARRQSCELPRVCCSHAESSNISRGNTLPVRIDPEMWVHAIPWNMPDGSSATEESGLDVKGCGAKCRVIAASSEPQGPLLPASQRQLTGASVGSRSSIINAIQYRAS